MCMSFEFQAIWEKIAKSTYLVETIFHFNECVHPFSGFMNMSAENPSLDDVSSGPVSEPTTTVPTSGPVSLVVHAT